MQTIDKSTTDNKAVYFFDSQKQRFGFGDAYLNHGFAPDIKIIIDADLAAQDADKIFNKIFAGV